MYEVRYIERQKILEEDKNWDGIISCTVLVLQQKIGRLWKDVGTVKEDPQNEKYER